jgi:hypothetical protein
MNIETSYNVGVSKNTPDYRRFYYEEEFDGNRVHPGSQRLHGWAGG